MSELSLSLDRAPFRFRPRLIDGFSVLGGAGRNGLNGFLSSLFSFNSIFCPSNTVKNFSWFDFLVDTFETFFCSKYLNQEVGWFPPSFFLESNLFDLPSTLGFEQLLVSDRGDVLFSGSRDGDGCGGGRIGASGGKMRPCRTQ